MTSAQLKEIASPADWSTEYWLREIALQLAIMNERAEERHLIKTHPLREVQPAFKVCLLDPDHTGGHVFVERKNAPPLPLSSICGQHEVFDGE